jgi:hypothetical protein
LFFATHCPATTPAGRPLSLLAVHPLLPQSQVVEFWSHVPPTPGMELVQLIPHPPQFAGSEDVSVSHPFVSMPSQSAKGESH